MMLLVAGLLAASGLGCVAAAPLLPDRRGTLERTGGRLFLVGLVLLGLSLPQIW